MMSQNAAKSAVPSYYMIRTNLPHRPPLNQWQPVLYYAGITKRDQRRILLRHRKAEEVEHSAYQKSLSATLSAFDAWKQAPRRNASEVESAMAASSPQDLLRLVVQLNDHGLVHLSAPLVDQLHEQRRLSVAEYSTLISSLQAKRTGLHVLRSAAQHDPALTFKLMGDRQGSERAAEAQRISDMALTATKAFHHRNASSVIYNALMEVYMTCGYDRVKQVSGTVYDALGVHQISPTQRTYELVIQSLALQGNTMEAEHVLNFLRNRHADQITVGMINHLILGHRENKTFDQCDVLWNELVDRRWPRADVLSAELYLRSIVDHSYTRATDSVGRSGRIHTVEKKKVPIILSQMDTLGIPRCHLSRPLLDEVEDALRKYAIYPSRFYEWGRAVKQFDFIEFRRRQGWLYGVHEMDNITKMAPTQRDPTNPDAVMAPASGAELPEYFGERAPWMVTPLESTILLSDNRERMEDVRAGDIYYDDKESIHQRSANWSAEVPQTRYDQLYGMSNPDIPKIGIRRHLESEYVNRQQLMEKDANLVRKALSGARRVRKGMEYSTTHRPSATE